jgi:nucleoside-diphosphate-sugar epimerase
MRFDLVINLMTVNAVEKGRVLVLGSGRQWRPIVHVKDTAGAFIQAIEADQALVNGEVFNIGRENTQVISIGYTVRENIPFPITVDIVPENPDVRDYHVSFEKAKRVIGFESKYSVGDGVREIYLALKGGYTRPDPITHTVKWYTNILEAREIIDRVMLDGRLI